MKIAIGTTSGYKVNAIKRALADLDIDCDVFPVKAETEVSEQPQAVNETRLGAENRARNALKLAPECDLAVGVEFGYEPVNENWHMLCWASIYTKEGKLFSEQSSTLQLPKLLADGLQLGTDVNSQLEDLKSTIPDQQQGRKFWEFIKKRRPIYESVENVIIRWHFDQTLY